VVAQGVRLILAPNPSHTRGAGTNSYLLGRGEVVVVDPGPDLPEHVDALLAQGRVVGQLITHGHEDHLPAALRLRERVGAPIYGHPKLPGVDRPLADGQRIELVGWRLQALATPGHAPEHLVYWVEERRLIFTGDLIAGVGTIVLSEAPNALAQYLDSLLRLLALGPSMLLPGHGPRVDDGLAKIREYLDHRMARERQIVAALGEGGATVDELVTKIYSATPPALIPLAARNVRAHLDRLQALGRAQPVGERWGLTGS
jgi:glyoxylase-like metal-dependent hydrolase (beta-lactamase superfamily II)